MKLRPLSGIRCEQGASAVEFALLAAPFLFLVFGTIEFARALWTTEAAHQVAMEVARCAAVLRESCAQGGMISINRALMFAREIGGQYGIPLKWSDIAIDTKATCGGIAGFVSVSISYSFDSAIPFIAEVLGEGAKNIVACFPSQGA